MSKSYDFCYLLIIGLLKLLSETYPIYTFKMSVQQYVKNLE